MHTEAIQQFPQTLAHGSRHAVCTGWGPGFAVLLAFASCGGGSSASPARPDAAIVADGPFVADIASNESSSPICREYALDGGAPTPFGAIQQIFSTSCMPCHFGVDGGVDGGAALDLDPASAWTNLVGRPAPAPETCGGMLVVPGKPDESYLYQKLTEDHPCSGERMPKGDVALPLPDCLIALVRAWIADGATGPASGGDGGNPID
jgi:hypothetical protein